MGVHVQLEAPGFDSDLHNHIGVLLLGAKTNTGSGGLRKRSLNCLDGSLHIQLCSNLQWHSTTGLYGKHWGQ